jgi:phage/plasmid-associated DNA primase
VVHDSIRWVPSVDWFWFDGTRWRRDRNGELMRRAKDVTQAIIDGSKYFPPDARTDAIKFALRSEQAPRLAAMIELAKSEKGICLPYPAFDRDPWLAGVERGAIDLRTGEFLLPPANAYLSRRLGTEFNPHSQCPTWCAFLDRITNGDEQSSTARPLPSLQACAYKSSSHRRLGIRSDNGSRTEVCEVILEPAVPCPDRTVILAPGIALAS